MNNDEYKNALELFNLDKSDFSDVKNVIVNHPNIDIDFMISQTIRTQKNIKYSSTLKENKNDEDHLFDRLVECTEIMLYKYMLVKKIRQIIGNKQN